MNCKEFVKIIKEDSVTCKNENIKSLLKFIEIILEDINCDIAPDKNLNDIYKFMYDYAKNNAKDNCYVMSDEIAKKIIFEYLEINEKSSKCIKSLDLFF